MPELITQSILCPVLIGRDAQIAALARLLDQARSGQGQIALISGEAGIGKSRLVTETKRRAVEQGMVIRQGNCFEPDRTLPYAPFLDLLRTIRSETPSSANLIALLSGQQAQADEEPEAAKRRLFTALADFLLTLTHGAADKESIHYSQLIIIEDLHWCDETSLEFLLQLARRVASQPLLLLLTLRGDEAPFALKQFLANLDRTRLAHELIVNRLAPADTELMIRTIFAQQQPVRPEFVERIHSLTEGNPFFTEELLKALVATGAIFFSNGRWERKPITELHIPRTVQVAVAQRVVHLNESAQQLLQLAAVVGRRFDFSLLQTITGQSEAALLNIMKELLRAQLVVEESAESFAFRHALTQQAVYSSLLVREQRVLHRQIAETLEARLAEPATDLYATLAQHFYAAAQWEKTITYAHLAAAGAQKLYAAHAALEHLNRAYYAAQQLQRTPPLGLFGQRGRMYEWLGELDAAQVEYTTALELARHQSDPRAEWQSLLELGMLARERDFARSGQLLQEALLLARQLADDACVAHTLVWLGLWYGMMDRASEAERDLQEAQRIFQRLHDTRGIAMTLDMIGNAWYHSGDLATSVYYHQAALTIYRELDDRWGQVNCLTMLAGCAGDIIQRVSLAPPANLVECERAYEQALHLTRQSEWRSGEAYALIWYTFGLSVRGEYRRALAYAQDALQIAEELGQTRWIAASSLVLGALYLDLLALPQVCQIIEPLFHLSTHQVSAIASIYTSLLAMAYIEQGKLAEAQGLLATQFAPDAPAISTPQRSIWWARARLALARQQAEEALAIADRLVTVPARRSNLPVSATADLAAINPIFRPQPPTAEDDAVIPEMWALRGEALLAHGRVAEAEALLQRTYRVAQEQSLRPLQWRVLALLARLYQGQRRRAEMAAAVDAAQQVIAALATQVTDPTLRQQFLAQTYQRLPKLSPATPAQRAKQAANGLTAREREVALLIGQGKSNKEVAEAMVVSFRTVETHVSNILAKLHLTSRAQIAVWAREIERQGAKE